MNEHQLLENMDSMVNGVNAICNLTINILEGMVILGLMFLAFKITSDLKNRQSY